MKPMLKMLLLSYFFLLTGCATRIDQLSGSHDRIEVALDGNSGEAFYLKSGSGAVVAAATVENARLVFQLDEETIRHHAKSCFFISNAKGERLELFVGGNQGFSNPLFAEYLQHVRQIHELEQKNSEAKSAVNHYQAQYQQAASWLQNSPVFQQGNCIRPELGERPMLACEPSEARDKGVSICLIKNLGCDGFSGFASRSVGAFFGKVVVSFLSGTSCELIASELLEQENSVIAEVAKSAGLFYLSRLGWPGLVAAGAFKVYEFNDCTDAVQQKCSEKYRQWLNAPELAQRQCQEQLDVSINAPARIQGLQASVDAGESKIGVLNDRLYQLKNRKVVLTADCSLR